MLDREGAPRRRRRNPRDGSDARRSRDAVFPLHRRAGARAVGAGHCRRRTSDGAPPASAARVQILKHSPALLIAGRGFYTRGEWVEGSNVSLAVVRVGMDDLKLFRYARCPTFRIARPNGRRNTLWMHPSVLPGWLTPSLIGTRFRGISLRLSSGR